MKHILIAALFAALPIAARAAPYAILNGSNVVANIVEGDPSNPRFRAAFAGAVPLTAPGGMGSIYDPNSRTFSPPGMPTQVWLARFSQDEHGAIEASPDAGVQAFLRILDASSQVNVSDPVTQLGVQYLVAKGLLTSARAAQILQ